MLLSKFFLYTALITFIMAPTIGLCSPADEKSCLTAECHVNMADGERVHPDDALCPSCHINNNSNHPDPEKINFSLKLTCLECHEKIIDHDRLHSPVAAGDCTACHLAHGLQSNNYLHEQNEIICYSCHADLRKEGENILHGNSTELDCKQCHLVHGSDYQKLLRGRYSTSFFNDYQTRHYEICFRCHKEDLLLHPQTSFNTEFRDGKNNLHFVHVNRRNKGRACKSCHKIHAGTVEHLIADRVAFGNWQMPVNFTPTEHGGKCSPGCHRPQEYDRGKK